MFTPIGSSISVSGHSRHIYWLIRAMDLSRFDFPNTMTIEINKYIIQVWNKDTLTCIGQINQLKEPDGISSICANASTLFTGAQTKNIKMWGVTSSSWKKKHKKLIVNTCLTLHHHHHLTNLRIPLLLHLFNKPNKISTRIWPWLIFHTFERKCSKLHSACWICAENSQVQKVRNFI